VKRADESNQKAEGDEPQNRQDEINGPVNKATAEWKKPEKGEEHGKSPNSLSVDEAALGPGVVAQGLVGVKPLACETDDDCCKGELADAEHHGEDGVSEWCHFNMESDFLRCVVGKMLSSATVEAKYTK